MKANMIVLVTLLLLYVTTARSADIELTGEQLKATSVALSAFFDRANLQNYDVQILETEKRIEVIFVPRHPKDKLTVQDRKSTRLNSSHVEISYAVFCLK